jgi:hypothetical protein
MPTMLATCPAHTFPLTDGRCLVFTSTCDQCTAPLDERLLCPTCSVDHSGPRCASCGHRGYHMAGCPEGDK